jgi:hypothetical protein
MADIVTQFSKLENFQVEREREGAVIRGWMDLVKERGGMLLVVGCFTNVRV